MLSLPDLQAANILVVAGTDVHADNAANVLNADLGLDNTVTIVHTGVPASLAGYTQIYDVRWNSLPAFTVAEKIQYMGFLNAAPGNTLFLMGEWVGCCTLRNTAITSFIAMAGGGTIPVPTTSSRNAETVNPPFTAPNVIGTVVFSDCGVLTSSGTGAFASTEAGGTSGCAIYFGLGTLANAPQGALVVVNDINFIETAPTVCCGSVNEVPFRRNLEQFSASPTTPPTISYVSPTSGPPSGGTIIGIHGTGFTRATGVTIAGTPATDVVVVNDTTIRATTPAGSPGPASVIVSTPNGVNSPNSMFYYAVPTSGPPPLPPLQLSISAPVNLRVVANASLTVSQSVHILSNQTGTGSWQAKTQTPWLMLGAAQGPFYQALAVTADATGMAVGSYEGTITVSSHDEVSDALVTLTVPVTLTVLPPASITVSSAYLPNAFGYPVGSATGYDVQIGPPGVAFTAQTSAESASWLSITPSSATAPATLHVTIDPGKASYGVYQASIVITSPGAPNSPLSIPVRMILSSLVPVLPEQVNMATGAGPDHTVAPNELVSLSLSDFSCSSQPVVSLDGVPVGWSEYAPGQINYLVPPDVAQMAVLSVACDGSIVWSFHDMNVAATVPGIFASGGNRSQAVAMNSDGVMNQPAAAAARGTYLTVFVTGFGVFDVASGDGLRRLAGDVEAQIGGIPATVQYAGEAPGNIDGVQQINLLIPPNSPIGPAVPLTITVDGTPAQPVTIAVK